MPLAAANYSLNLAFNWFLQLDKQRCDEVLIMANQGVAILMIFHVREQKSVFQMCFLK